MHTLNCFFSYFSNQIGYRNKSKTYNLQLTTYMTTSEIKLKVTVDENHLPQKIEWEAPDAKEGSVCKSMMLALWDEKENNTMRIDLWTKDMSVDEMKKFFHQNIVTLSDTYLRATNDEATVKELRDFMSVLGKKMGVLA